MSQRDQIIQGIENLGGLQGESNRRKINDLSEQTGYVRNLMHDLPTLFDKYEYTKRMSRQSKEAAEKVSKEIYQTRRYVESSKDLPKTVKDNLLIYLNSIEEGVGSIIIPPEEEGQSARYYEPDLTEISPSRFGGKKMMKRKKTKKAKSIRRRHKRSRRR